MPYTMTPEQRSHTADLLARLRRAPQETLRAWDETYPTALADQYDLPWSVALQLSQYAGCRLEALKQRQKSAPMGSRHWAGKAAAIARTLSR